MRRDDLNAFGHAAIRFEERGNQLGAVEFGIGVDHDQTCRPACNGRHSVPVGRAPHALDNVGIGRRADEDCKLFVALFPRLLNRRFAFFRADFGVAAIVKLYERNFAARRKDRNPVAGKQHGVVLVLHAARVIPVRKGNDV
ncbi:hypothetical protein XI06_22870 [Bradyrhizobium sp. CCBAU 11434]|nr:hypothetical protein [Bradyrhizobium sp. CCBAU 11434]